MADYDYDEMTVKWRYRIRRWIKGLRRRSWKRQLVEKVETLQQSNRAMDMLLTATAKIAHQAMIPIDSQLNKAKMLAQQSILTLRGRFERSQAREHELAEELEFIEEHLLTSAKKTRLILWREKRNADTSDNVVGEVHPKPRPGDPGDGSRDQHGPGDREGETGGGVDRSGAPADGSE
jgi:hypothetical protein